MLTILQQEKEKLRSELEGALVSAIFDGTTRNGEALDLVGTKFVTPKLDKFMKHWFRIFQHSSRQRCCGEKQLGWL